MQTGSHPEIRNVPLVVHLLNQDPELALLISGLIEMLHMPPMFTVKANSNTKSEDFPRVLKVCNILATTNATSRKKHFSVLADVQTLKS